MRLYKVYFQIYGKKMVTKIMASSEESARQIVKDSIQFDKTEMVPPDAPRNNTWSPFDEFFGKL